MTHLHRVRTRTSASSQGRRRRGKSDDFPPPVASLASQHLPQKVYQAVAAVSLRNFVPKLVANRAEPEPWLAADCYSSPNQPWAVRWGVGPNSPPPPHPTPHPVYHPTPHPAFWAGWGVSTSSVQARKLRGVAWVGPDGQLAPSSLLARAHARTTTWYKHVGRRCRTVLGSHDLRRHG